MADTAAQRQFQWQQPKALADALEVPLDALLGRQQPKRRRKSGD